MSRLRSALFASLALAVSALALGKSDAVAPNFEHELLNVPGKSLTAVVVTYPPGGASGPHRHAKSAFIYGYVLSGSVVMQVEGQPLHTYKAGESFYENPEAHHIVSRNASKTQTARFLAVFVVDTNDKVLTTFDRE
jgi:quercetin dioxygenase-like cupin family protein